MSGQLIYEQKTVIRYIWRFRGDQLELLELLIKADFGCETNKLLNLGLKWVGEGPHVLLLSQLLKTSIDATEVSGETLYNWPKPLNVGFLAPFTYPDPLFLEIIARLAHDDPGFGGSTELQSAVLSNDTEAVQALLNHLPNVKLSDRNFLGQSALHLAIRNPNIVKQLIGAGFEHQPDITDTYGLTPLMYSAIYGEIESTKALLGAGANPFMVETLNGMSMWHYALRCNKQGFLDGVLQYYLEAFAEHAELAKSFCLWIRLTCDDADLRDAALDTLSAILRTRPTLALVFPKQISPLQLCRNTEEALLLLQSYDDPINMKNALGYHPLIVYTKLRNNERLLKIAIERGSDVNAKDCHHMSALHHLNSRLTDKIRWGGSDFDEWMSWLNNTVALIRAGADILQGDKCSCPCSVGGCSHIRGIFWTSPNTPDSQKGTLRAVPWILELYMFLKITQPSATLKMMVANLFRLQTFEEWEMKHTCCLHGDRWPFGTRPYVSFHWPYKEPWQSRHCAFDDWGDEFAEITDEQKEFTQSLDSVCDEYLAGLQGSIEAELLKVLAHRVVFLENRLEATWKEEQENIAARRRSRAMGPEPPAGALKISEGPRVVYADTKRDLFWEKPISFSNYLRAEDCKFDKYLSQFVDKIKNSPPSFVNDSMCKSSWLEERKRLISDLMQEILILRGAEEDGLEVSNG
ncbi:hypothetical protein B0J12DRAFT_658255 [Macrophomina phaseolina]|uniref:Uncharacterized protein n=1 Tax=Macrophomina phaseolina TaxID=35725 RepID=A0ABQ8GG31_9PEZI|nr:hypothetical protein B0J12DRAFT_658255 [Macrophomina phaseolina]